jgi:flagellar motor switch protein FliG
LRLRDVEEAQDQIVVLTKNLADKGEVTITDPSSNEELVY